MPWRVSDILKRNLLMHDANRNQSSTMAWAIDLDNNGTAINGLGSSLGRQKAEVYNSTDPLWEGPGDPP